MSQHDMNIANQGFPAFRSDLNDALAALASTNSGATAPVTTFANQWWYDTTADALKIRNEANSAWITVATLDQATNTLIAIGGKTLPTGSIVGTSDSQTLTNKSLLAPKINGATSGQTTLIASDTVSPTLTLPSSSGTLALSIAPEVTRYTSGTGTYITPTGAKYLTVELSGGGGGGSGDGATPPVAGGAGGTTTFGSSIASAGGGSGTGNLDGGNGGVVLYSPAIGWHLAGGGGGGGSNATSIGGANGGTNPLGGGGKGGNGAGASGGAGVANTGAGGGAGGGSTARSNGSGGAGAYIFVQINSPAATYSYTVGAGGTAGTGVTTNGGAGAAGVIIVTAYF